MLQAPCRMAIQMGHVAGMTNFINNPASRNAVGFYVLFTVLLILSLSAQAAAGKAIVGLLSTQYSTYAGEDRTAKDIEGLLLKLGAERVVLIDYNVIMKELGAGSDALSIVRRVDKFLLDNEIDRVFIPGNYYNISSPPFPPVPYRQLVTDAIVSIMQDRHDIKLLAICGGLQGVLHSQKVKIKRLDSMLRSSEMVASHNVSEKHPREYGKSLLGVNVVPGSKLAKIIESARGAEAGGSLRFYVPDMHNEGIDIGEHNVKRLLDLGYKVTAYADDGIIEAVEDSRGNMLLQMHPEFLLIGMEKKVGQHAEVDVSIKIALGIMDDFLSN
ncbi:gamma-glutamyl-gamma-aminobutyrate hydrolase family protein [Anaplasma phagocytophilum]|uniref:gamma-glutamyl-gamma-aminobutyrate hydrolase family protein n=1 Tax=Anaplasma phagocytophilum TaxID=948 RepID=UPI00201A39EA